MLLVTMFFILSPVLGVGLEERMELSSVFISSVKENLEDESKIVSAMEMVETINHHSQEFVNSLKQEYSQDDLVKISNSINLNLEDLVLKFGFEQEFKCSGETAVFAESGLRAPAQNITEQFAKVDPGEVLEDNHNPCFRIDQRLTGTDLAGGKLAETIVDIPEQCQDACLENNQCRFFMFFSMHHYQPWKRGMCRLLALRGEYEIAPGHVSGPRNCSTTAKSLTLKSNIIDLFKTTLRNVLSIECRRRIQFSNRIDNLKILLMSILEVYCSEFSLSSENELEGWILRLKRGLQTLMRSQGLDENDFIPEHQPWLQSKLGLFSLAFATECGPILDQI